MIETWVACPLCGATVKQAEIRDGMCGVCQLFKDKLIKEKAIKKKER